MTSRGPEWEPAEEAVVVFFDRNIFGLMKTGAGAPAHSAVAKWLNVYSPPSNGNHELRWAAKPIVRNDMYEALRRAENSQITQSTFTVIPGNLSDDDLGILGLARDFVGRGQDGLSVTLTIKAGRKKDERAANSELIEAQVDRVFHTLDVEKAQVNAKIDEGRIRTFDLLEQKITMQAPLPFSALEGGDFAQTAAGEIRSAYTELGDSLLDNVPVIENRA